MEGFPPVEHDLLACLLLKAALEDVSVVDGDRQENSAQWAAVLLSMKNTLMDSSHHHGNEDSGFHPFLLCIIMRLALFQNV